MTNNLQITSLKQLLLAEPELEFAVLVGSRANNTAKAHSDWDIALRWNPQIDYAEMLAMHEALRQKIANCLQTNTDNIDLIDLANTNLTMRAIVAEEGIILSGEETLAWAHFLTRTWRELEDFYWEKNYRGAQLTDPPVANDKIIITGLHKLQEQTGFAKIVLANPAEDVWNNL